MGGRSASCQVLPRSSEYITEGPKWPYSMPASSRGMVPRVSIATECTPTVENWIGSTSNGPPPDERARNRPLRVPIASIASVMASLPCSLPAIVPRGGGQPPRTGRFIAFGTTAAVA